MKTIGDMTIHVNKAELLLAIRSNRDEHRGIFLKALDGYRIEMVELLQGHIDRLNKGKVVEHRVYLPVPEDHTRDYDRIIDMLEIDLRESLDLSENQYAWYVKDDWGWKEEWIGSTQSYAATEV